ncbi:MAG: type II toxin-antitoxin system RelE/ParE family toxin [Chloroflexota bacterium]|nr:type II toxin-antitoxin system RelE/ParE family toxin [Chloroflexota bacterium]MDE2908357.1 type II toxin-antitoxin system RelE/ParE family toxin [Chloroflexota bacterium]
MRPTLVRDLPRFKKRLGRIERKYPKTIDAVESLIASLAQGKRPGQRIPRVGYTVYKVRLPNRAARRGKSGGFRVIYYAQVEDVVTLLTIYSKSEESDISAREIEQLAREADEAAR